MNTAWPMPIKNLQNIKASTLHLAQIGTNTVNILLAVMPIKSIRFEPNIVAKIRKIMNFHAEIFTQKIDKLYLKYHQRSTS